MEALLSSRISGLCFSKDDFIVKDFSVDKFVSNYRKHVPLETLLADLALHHKILCSAMIELINKDYGEFLNLASNLVDLDKSIKILCMPLKKLECDIYNLAKKSHDACTDESILLRRYSSAHKRKLLCYHVFCATEGLAKLEKMNALFSIETSLDILERMALDFNIVQFHIQLSFKKASCLPTLELELSKGISVRNCVDVENEKRIEKICDSLKKHLGSFFLESLSENDAEILCRVLHIYSIIGMQAELEKLFSKVIVKPYMECHITEEKILKFGLPYVYERILNFITSSAMLLDATRGTKICADFVPGFDFLVNSIFPEVVYCFDLITPIHIYAHGNTEKFHENYTSTMHFLGEFEHFCGNQTSVRRLRETKTYRNFLKKWNLDVYFQMRFSEIAGNFEKCLLEGFVYPKDLKLDKGGKSYLLNTCNRLSECVNLCYHEKVFLKSLSHYFFRLNLKLISQFYKSACLYLESDKEESTIPVDAAVMIRDVEMLITELTNLFEKTIIHYIPRNVVEIAFQQSLKLLENLIPLANTVMTDALIKGCCVHLKLILDIPRLYRKTNREVPSKPSNYVSLLFNNLTAFISETKSILPAKSKKIYLLQVANGIITQCVVMVRDVLTAIEKMEHSLRILKRARDKNPVGGSSGITDDDKIRLQLVIDINVIEEKINELELDISNLRSFEELKSLMSSTKKILPQNF